VLGDGANGPITSIWEGENRYLEGGGKMKTIRREATSFKKSRSSANRWGEIAASRGGNEVSFKER